MNAPKKTNATYWLGGKHRDRPVTPITEGQPFYSFGNTWRGDYELKAPGWYLLVGGTLRGPYTTKAEAARC